MTDHSGTTTQFVAPSVSLNFLPDGAPVLEVQGVPFQARAAERFIRYLRRALRRASALPPKNPWRIGVKPASLDDFAYLTLTRPGMARLEYRGRSWEFTAQGSEALLEECIERYYRGILPWLTKTNRRAKLNDVLGEIQKSVDSLAGNAPPPPAKPPRPQKAPERPQGTFPWFEKARGCDSPGSPLGAILGAVEGESVLVSAVEWRDARFLHLQRWWPDLDLRYRPGKSPITIRLREINRFVGVLQRAVRKGFAKMSVGRLRGDGLWLTAELNQNGGFLSLKSTRGGELELPLSQCDELLRLAGLCGPTLAGMQYQPWAEEEVVEVLATGTHGGGEVPTGVEVSKGGTEPATRVRAQRPSASFRCSGDREHGEPKKRFPSSAPEGRLAGQGGQISLTLVGGVNPQAEKPKPKRKKNRGQLVVGRYYGKVRERLGPAAPNPNWAKDLGRCKRMLLDLDAMAEKQFPGASQEELRARVDKRVGELMDQAWEDKWFRDLTAPHFGCFYSIWTRLNSAIVVGRQAMRRKFYEQYSGPETSVDPGTIYAFFERHVGHEGAIREVTRVHGAETAKEFGNG